MKKCNKCNISYTGGIDTCPLCQSELIGKKSDSVFPTIKKQKKGLLYKILLFVSFTIGVIFSFIEFMISRSLFISKFVIAGLFTNYITVLFIVKNARKVLEMLNKYFFICMLFLFLWFYVTKSLIITTYIIPILCLVIFAFNTIIMLILKNQYVAKFTKILLLDCLVGLIPLGLVFLKLTTFPLLSYICVLIDLLLFVGLLIFCYGYIIEELRKIFNY